MNAIRVVQVPVLQDNYAYLVIDEETRDAVLIDPAQETERLTDAIRAQRAALRAVLCTHHHWDHAGGVDALLSALGGSVPVVASHQDATHIDAFSRPGVPSLRVAGDDQPHFGSLSARVLLLPCHTRGHVAYLFGDDLFCGDTLFVGGCGRFFEGDASDMHRALNHTLGALPASTRVHCGHEYTVSNLAFAQTIEPENRALQQKLAWAKEQRAAGLSTVPSTLGEERAYNPFLRVSEPSVQQAVGASDAVDAMAKLRERKNQFRG
jgi:hydroxyacylglutathione hydrolase